MSVARSRSRRTRWTRGVLLALAAGVLLLLALGAVGTANVVSPSMAPSYDVGTTLLTTSMGATTPDRGDVVVFEVPDTWSDSAAESGADLTSGLMIKRVVGVEGDHVVCCAPGGHLVVNDEVLDESYLAAPPESMSNTTYDVTVPRGHVWLLGDNRRRSFDSRAMQVRVAGAGFVPVEALRALVISGF